MRDLRNNDVGTTVDFSAGFSKGDTLHTAAHPWPDETTVSAGDGVVFTRGADGSNQSYETLFMEVYPPDASFIRGEGETPADCENAAWEQYQLALHCVPEQEQHLWEPRNYRNGAGFCKHCNTFKSSAFTPQELRSFCSVCQTPTFWQRTISPSGEEQMLCEEHETVSEPTRRAREALANISGKDLAAGITVLVENINPVNPTKEATDHE